MPFRRLHFAAAVAAFALAACQDSHGPGSLSDPTAVTAELAAIDSAFQSPAFESYSSLAPLITPTAGASLRTAAIIVEGSTPALVNEPAYLRGARRADAWRRLAPLMSASTMGPIIPDPVVGTTFEWDLATSAYAATTRTGAPTNGVRFILYTINSITHEPVDPLVEVGFVDLMDESSGNTLRLHIQIKGVGGTPTYLDYTATITPGNQTLTATVNGNVTNGAAGGPNKTLTYALTFEATQTAVTANASFDLNNPAVSVDVFQRVFVSGSALTLAVDFRFARPGELVRLTGSVLLESVGDELRITGDMVVTVNGGIFARLHTEGQTGSWTKHDGSALTAQEVEALENLFASVEHFFNFVADLLQPVDDLIEA
jgi:hypothetical protein